MSAVTKSRALVADIEHRDADLECGCGGGWWFDYGEPSYSVHTDECPKCDLGERELYALAAVSRHTQPGTPQGLKARSGTERPRRAGGERG